jgi:hypothetical protein
MGEHTPGPWEHHYPSATGDYWVGQAGDDGPIAVVIAGDDEGAANVKLITAAPAMLLALEAVVGAMAPFDSPPSLNPPVVTLDASPILHAYEAAREALKEARDEPASPA